VLPSFKERCILSKNLWLWLDLLRHWPLPELLLSLILANWHSFNLPCTCLYLHLHGSTGHGYWLRCNAAHSKPHWVRDCGTALLLHRNYPACPPCRHCDCACHLVRNIHGDIVQTSQMSNQILALQKYFLAKVAREFNTFGTVSVMKAADMICTQKRQSLSIHVLNFVVHSEEILPAKASFLGKDFLHKWQLNFLSPECNTSCLVKCSLRLNALGQSGHLYFLISARQNISFIFFLHLMSTEYAKSAYHYELRFDVRKDHSTR
jgi:hypothetical protein